jgi:hypothetical protein
MTKDSLSPCAADALFNTRQLTIAGKQVRIAGFDAAFAAVQARGLTEYTEISAELMRRIRENNFITPALAHEYAATVLAEYKRTVAK